MHNPALHVMRSEANACTLYSMSKYSANLMQMLIGGNNAEGG